MKDLFISYVSQDKDFASELNDAMQVRGVSTTDGMLCLGDILSRRIDQGLRDARFGVLILSKAFFKKPWSRHDIPSPNTIAPERRPSPSSRQRVT